MRDDCLILWCHVCHYYCCFNAIISNSSKLLVFCLWFHTNRNKANGSVCLLNFSFEVIFIIRAPAPTGALPRLFRAWGKLQREGFHLIVSCWKNAPCTLTNSLMGLGFSANFAHFWPIFTYFKGIRKSWGAFILGAFIQHYIVSD